MFASIVSSYALELSLFAILIELFMSLVAGAVQIFVLLQLPGILSIFSMLGVSSPIPFSLSESFSHSIINFWHG